MKFSVSSSELLKHLQLAGGAIATNPVLPILDDFLFSLDGNQLTITASDLETTITSQLEVKPDSKAANQLLVAVPARILLDTLKALPEQPITFTVDEETFGVTITSAYGKYRLAGEDGSDFPDVPEPVNTDITKVKASILEKGITKTLFATSTDDLRPALTGVYFVLDFNSLTFVATDAHKLVRYTFSDLPGELTASFIVPKKSLNQLKNVLATAEEDDSVQLAFNKKNAFFSIGSVTLAATLIDQRYPDYNAVIPANNPNHLVIKRTDLLNSLRRIAIYANKTTNQVVFDIAPNSLTISAQDLDFSNEAAEQLICSYDGPPFTIGFNGKFLIEMLSVLDTEEVRFELSTPQRAGILVPVDEPANESILMLVMPVMLVN
ncbi:MAG: DNA polymerase III subunit beta [Saprospiraceae bacterium]|nr:MAG: DNA polymerase III subunit beta [Saprospiraceae bacterium]